MSKNHPLDDLTSSDFIYQALKSIVAAVFILTITYLLTPLFLEFLHEAYIGIYFWLDVVMDYTWAVD
jgi:hypothetical protein